jgi:hypothetical protein
MLINIMGDTLKTSRKKTIHFIAHKWKLEQLSIDNLTDTVQKAFVVEVVIDVAASGIEPEHEDAYHNGVNGIQGF